MVTISPYTGKPVGGTSKAAKEYYAKQGYNGGSNSNNAFTSKQQTPVPEEKISIAGRLYSPNAVVTMDRAGGLTITDSGTKTYIPPGTQISGTRGAFLNTGKIVEPKTFNAKDFDKVINNPPLKPKTVNISGDNGRSEDYTPPFVALKSVVELQRSQEGQGNVIKRSPTGRRLVRSDELQYSQEEYLREVAALRASAKKPENRMRRDIVTKEAYPAIYEREKEVEVIYGPNEYSILTKKGQAERLGNLKNTMGGVVENLGREAYGLTRMTSFGLMPNLPGNKKEFEADVQDLTFKQVVEEAALKPGKAGLMVAGAMNAPTLAGVAGRTALMGEFGLRGTQAASRGMQSSEEREIIKKIGANAFLNAQQSMQAAESQKVAGNAFKIPFTSRSLSLKSMAFEGIPGAQMIPGISSEKAFINSARQQAANLGLSGRESDAFVQASLRERRAGSVGEVLGLVSAGFVTEEAGRQAFANLNKVPVFNSGKFSWQGFKQGFRVIAPLGAIEGPVQTSVQSRARGREATPFELAFSSVFGATSAGTLGGGIYGAAGKPLTRKGLSAIGNIMDPTEYPGDVLADVNRALRKATGEVIKEPRVPVIGINPMVPNIGSNTQAKTKSTINVKAKEKSSRPPVFSDVFNLESIIGVPSDSTTPTPVPIGTPVNVPITTPVNVPSDVPSNVLTNINTPVSVNTPTSVPISVAAFTPMGRLPPPLLLPGLGFPQETKGSGGRGNKQSIFVNELAAGQALLGSLLGGNVGRQMRQDAVLLNKQLYKQSKKKSKKSKKKKNTQKDMILPPSFDFPILFGNNKKEGGGLLPFKIL